MKRLFMLTLVLGLALGAFAQNPTSQAALTVVNATTVQGVGQGYYPTEGTGLTLKLGPGMANCGGLVGFGGGSYTLAPSATSYLFINTTSLVNYCLPALNKTGFGSNIPIAKVVTSAKAITSLNDFRTMFTAGPAATGGQGAFSIVSGELYHYKDVVALFRPNAGVLGTVEIALPPAVSAGNANALNMTINGFSWPWGAWTLQVGGWAGFNQCSPGASTAWCGASASITGAFPYGYVRLGYDTSLKQFVVLLGTTATSWDSLTVEVTDFTVTSGAPLGLQNGWSMTMLTSESKITNVNKVYNATAYAAVGPVPAEGNGSTGSGLETSVNLEVQGSSLDVPLVSGPTMSVYHYRDLISANTWASPSELLIALPSAGEVSGVTGEINMTIQGFDYNSNSAWQVMVGGLAGYPTLHEWGKYSATVSGNPPFTSVRMGYDTTLGRYVVLLGPLSTPWGYPWAEVSDFIVGFQDESNWGTGWSMTAITSESGVTNLVTPATTWPTGQTVPASSCGSLPGAQGCTLIQVNGGAIHYQPYW
jgi:hypothetical protein